jgi:hypothetical protein
LKRLVVISYRTPRKCVRVFCAYNGYPAAKDNRDSLGMCTTSVECKIVIIVMLTVMSGMDHHMISETCDGFWLSLGWVVSKWVLLGCGSITVRLHDAIEVISLRR